jgi:hypothetical protein
MKTCKGGDKFQHARAHGLDFGHLFSLKFMHHVLHRVLLEKKNDEANGYATPQTPNIKFCPHGYRRFGR